MPTRTKVDVHLYSTNALFLYSVLPYNTYSHHDLITQVVPKFASADTTDRHLVSAPVGTLDHGDVGALCRRHSNLTRKSRISRFKAAGADPAASLCSDTHPSMYTDESRRRG